MSSDLTNVTGLSDLTSWASPEEVELVKILLEAGQAHLFAGWKIGADEGKKHAFFDQVSLSLLPRGGHGGPFSIYIRRETQLIWNGLRIKIHPLPNHEHFVNHFTLGIMIGISLYIGTEQN